jgi:1-acyl-sn-glycerol-3-phosphate acyltransferase
MVIHKLLHLVSMTIVRLYAWLMLRLDVFWQAPFPAGPKLIVANHPSTTDPFYLGLLSHQPISLLIIESLFLIPVFGAFLRWSGHIPVVPGKGRTAFDAAYRRLLRGRSVALFPEGDLSPQGGGYLPPRTGAARLALMTGVPTIPIGIYLPRERSRAIASTVAGKRLMGYLYLRGEYGVTVGQAMRFEGDVEDRRCVATVSEDIMRQIISLAQESERRVKALLGGGDMACSHSSGRDGG